MKKRKKLNIVYEDKDIIIINKDAHLLTISTINEKENTLYFQVSSYLKKQNKNNKVFIVHRLDKETSGLIIFAKSLKVKKILQDNWSYVKRGYIALVHGNIYEDKGIIKSYLKETKSHFVYSTIKGTKEAITEYEVIKRSNLYSLLKIMIKTGKKHQIRVHLNDIGHPIVGEKTYSKFKDKKDRLYLHAYFLEFKHPINNKLIKIDISYPNIFLNYFK